MADVLVDGDFTMASAVGPRRFEYPFRQNGDRVTAFFEEEYWQTFSTFTPQEFSIRHSELLDFYLIKESLPAEFMARLCKFVRTYSRIPVQQTVPSSIIITQPNLPIVCFWTEQRNGSLSFNVPRAVFASNDMIYAEGELYFPFKAISADVANGSNRRLTITGHGFTATTKPLKIQQPGSANVVNVEPSVWDIVDANTVDLIGCAAFSGFTGANAAEFSRTYTPGGRHFRCNLITDYYLPGVSPGITTAADIPLPTDQSDDAAFLAALAAGTGTLNVQVGLLRQWMDSPILELTRTVIAAADI